MCSILRYFCVIVELRGCTNPVLHVSNIRGLVSSAKTHYVFMRSGRLEAVNIFSGSTMEWYKEQWNALRTTVNSAVADISTQLENKGEEDEDSLVQQILGLRQGINQNINSADLIRNFDCVPVGADDNEDIFVPKTCLVHIYMQYVL